MIQNAEFIEYAEVFGNYYGTSKEWVSDKLHKGHDVMLELDWQGALQAKKNGSPVPITEIIDGYYAEVQEMGGNRWDSSGLIARLKKKK